MIGDLLVIDESLTNRLATQLRRRGRNAKALSELGLKGSKDDVLLAELHSQLTEPWVLVTSDDQMPLEHAATVSRLRPRLAIVDPDVAEGYDPHTDQWECDVVHRWAHRMQKIGPGEPRRYGIASHHKWTKPRRPRSIGT